VKSVSEFNVFKYISLKYIYSMSLFPYQLLKLRADLREAITSQKWNQNSYIVGKSFGKMEAASSSR
jgi:hypothetical protein